MAKKRKTKNKNKMSISRRFSGRKIILTILLIGAVSLAYLLFFVPQVTGQIIAEIDSAKLIQLTNEQRRLAGLNDLSINPLLTQAAAKKAGDLIRKDYFSHNSPSGKKFSQWVIEQDYQYTIVGENLATGFTSDEEIIQAWMESPDHRSNILQPAYRDIGIAVLKGRLSGQTTYVIVQYFGATENQVISENLFPYSFAEQNIFYLNC